MNKSIVFTVLALFAISASATDWMRGIAVDGRVRFAPDKSAEGYYPIVDVCPAPIDENHMIAVDYWTNINEQCVCVYKQVEIPVVPEVHTYKKSFLAQWLYVNGYWATFKTLLTQSEDAAFFWETSTEFDSDHPQWPTIFGGIKTALGLTDEQSAAFLKAGETGGIMKVD